MKTKFLISELFNQPTAPFKELHVLTKIKEILEIQKIPYFTDGSGNIIAGVKSKAALWKKPYFVYIAHTDHPGFHITEETKKNTYKALWFGGAPFKQMKGKRVRIYNFKNTKSKTGKILDIDAKVYKRTGMDMTIQAKNISVGDFGSFYCPSCQFTKDKVITRCADDLAGCVMALGALIDVKKQKLPVVSIFTRAEEVGFVGAIGLLKSKILDPKYARVISLEASKTLPGAEIHKGPVVRLGDASTIFNSRMNRFVTLSAQELAKKDKTFKYQRRIMDGGSCEATAFDLYGFRTMGLSVPLVNYHNQGKRGPAPEIISILDVENGRKLLTEIAKTHKTFENATKVAYDRLETQFKALKGKLAEL